MLKKILFQIHWFIGITAGTILALNGLTGGVLAFRPQLLAHFGPQAQHVAATGPRLSLMALLQRALDANPGRSPEALTVAADATAPIKVQFARGPGPMGPGGGAPGGQAGPGSQGVPVVDPDAATLVDPYNGQVLPPSNGLSRFFATVESIHRGMWTRGTLQVVLRGAIAYSVLLLFFMALSGLYMRWPKGRAKRDWRAWFRINFRLKGAAFLFNLHTVVGTCVLLVYLMTAHTGLMIGRQLLWYRAAAQRLGTLIGLPAPPGMRGEGGPGGPGPAAAPPPTVATGLDAAWQTFAAQHPTFRLARVQLPDNEATSSLSISSGTQQGLFDPASGALRASAVIADVDDDNAAGTPGGDATLKEPLLAALVNGNPSFHTGQRWGVIGQAVLMCTSLAMPVLFVSGWMMYLKRRARKRRAAVRDPTAAPPIAPPAIESVTVRVQP